MRNRLSGDQSGLGLDWSASGYNCSMRFIKGFIFGTIFGIAAGSMVSEQQRRAAAERVARTSARWRPTGRAAATTAAPTNGAVANNGDTAPDATVDPATAGAAVNA